MLKIYFGLKGPSFQTTIDPVARFLDAVEERDAPDALDFMWMSDEALLDYLAESTEVTEEFMDVFIARFSR